MQRVLCGEGTLLNQQLFQQWDKYWHQHISNHQQLVGPYHWGFSVLDIEEKSLEHGSFRINAFELLLDNGELLQYKEPLQSYFLDCQLKEKKETIYLHISHPDAVADIVGYPQPKKRPSHKAHYTLAHDLYDESKVADIQTMEACFSLSSKPRQDSLYNIPVAKVSLLLGEHYQLEESFYAVMLHLQVNKSLCNHLNNLLLSLKKIHRCRDKKVLRTPIDLQFMLGIYQLRLQHILQCPKSSPYAVFLLLLELQQILSTDKDDDLTYLHHQAHKSIFALTHKILGSLHLILQQPLALLEYQHIASGLICFHDLKKFNAIQIISIECRCQRSENITLKQLSQQIKIAPRHEIHDMITHALPGLEFDTVHERNSPEHCYYSIIIELNIEIQTLCTTSPEYALCVYLPELLEPINAQSNVKSNIESNAKSDIKLNAESNENSQEKSID